MFALTAVPSRAPVITDETVMNGRHSEAVVCFELSQPPRTGYHRRDGHERKAF